jgi:hypothetical protein
VCSGVNTDEVYDFSDDDEGQVSMEEVERVEKDLEGARVARGAELRKETVVVFTEYRNYNRMEFYVKRGWAQYLPEPETGRFPDPVVGREPGAVTVSAGQASVPTTTVFFTPRSVTGGPGGVSPALPTETVVLNESPPV